MGYRNEVLYNGLHLMYIGEIIAVIGLFAGLTVLFLPGMIVLSLVILLAALVGAIVSVVGLARMRNEHGDYTIALILVVAGIVLNLIGNRAAGFTATVLDTVGSLIALVRVYFIIRATNGFLTEAGRLDVAEKGRRVMYIQIAGAVASAVIGGLAELFGGSLGILVVLLVISALLGIVIAVAYLSYLKASSAVFQ